MQSPEEKIRNHVILLHLRISGNEVQIVLYVYHNRSIYIFIARFTFIFSVGSMIPDDPQRPTQPRTVVLPGYRQSLYSHSQNSPKTEKRKRPTKDKNKGQRNKAGKDILAQINSNGRNLATLVQELVQMSGRICVGDAVGDAHGRLQNARGLV